MIVFTDWFAEHGEEYGAMDGHVEPTSHFSPTQFIAILRGVKGERERGKYNGRR